MNSKLIQFVPAKASKVTYLGLLLVLVIIYANPFDLTVFGQFVIEPCIARAVWSARLSFLL